MLSKVVRFTTAALGRRGVRKGTLGLESRLFMAERKSTTNGALWQRGLLPSRSIISSATYATKAKRSSTPKEFAINHPIAVDQYDQYCVLDPAEENEKQLIPAIRRGEYAILHGAPGSGKTTRIYRAMDQLKDEYICLMVDFQCIDFTNFWKSFGNTLQQMNKDVDLPKIQSSDDFLNLFITEDSFKNKKAVLFLDEFDKMMEAARDDRGQFLSLLRLLQMWPKKSLQSAVAVGTYSVVDIGVYALGSALSISEKILLRNWTVDEVTTLMHQFSRKILKEVLADIHKETNGYPQLVCLCGNEIKQNPAIGINFLKWHHYKLVLEAIVKNSPLVQRMLKMLSYTDSHISFGVAQYEINRAKLVREYLRPAISSDKLAIFNCWRKPPQLKYLIAEGVVAMLPNYQFTISSPLIHRILKSIPDDDTRA